MKSHIGYFGYGSLVNRQTLATDYIDCRPARLKGWRRHWQARPDGPEQRPGLDVALLTVHRHDESSILGMLVIDRAENLAHVDEREARYDRVEIDHASLSFSGEEDEADLPDRLFVYVGRPRLQPEPVATLVQSYLHTVMAGFLAEHGEEGLLHFIETTIGFDRPILVDRHQPLYTRHIPPEQEMADRFDTLLKEAGVRFTTS